MQVCAGMLCKHDKVSSNVQENIIKYSLGAHWRKLIKVPSSGENRTHHMPFSFLFFAPAPQTASICHWSNDTIQLHCWKCRLQPFLELDPQQLTKNQDVVWSDSPNLLENPFNRVPVKTCKYVGLPNYITDDPSV